MKILFTGGGTGGHVFPLIAVIREIRKFYPKKDLEFYYIGPKDEFGSILLSQEDVQVQTIVAGKIRRYFSFQNVIDILFKIPWSFVQAFFLLAKIEPNIVFSKGGSGALPVTLCARLFRIPVFVHESDIVPGLANRLTSKWAKKVFISFPKTEYFDLDKAILTGNPIRSELLEGSKDRAKELFGLTMEKPVILFIGGSQGAEFINDFILLMLNTLLNEFEIIHVTGNDNFKQVQTESQVTIDKNLAQYYHPCPFLDEEKLRHAYSAASLVIARSGSGSIFEIAAMGLPSILVPLPGSAGDHQAKNAYAYSEAGACIVMEQDNMKENFFIEKIHHLYADPARVEEMKESALRFSKPQAAKTIARTILEFLMIE